MSVKRYEMKTKYRGKESWDELEESPDGMYVRYEDLAESQREFRAADATIENLQMQVEKLAAENAGLKGEISNITFMRDDDFFGSTQRAQEVMGRLVNVKTPATDAFLAEVRAQGVEMFAANEMEWAAHWEKHGVKDGSVSRCIMVAQDAKSPSTIQPAPALDSSPKIAESPTGINQGKSEPVTTAYKLPFEQWLSQQTGTIDVECGCVMTEVFFHWLRVAYEAGNSPVIPDGYALVPVEPTSEMQSAAAGAIRFDTTPINKLWTGNAVYKAMIAAAPQQE